jgi:hypothetical protein
MLISLAINKIAPIVIKRSAGLKTNNEILPINKSRKSVTTPSKALSKRLPKAPPMINMKAACPIELFSFLRRLNRNKTITKPIINNP